MRWIVMGLGLGLAAAAVWLVWSRIDARHERELLERAAACNGVVTAERLEESAEEGMRQSRSHISIKQARRDVERLACPDMFPR